MCIIVHNFYLSTFDLVHGRYRAVNRSQLLKDGFLHKRGGRYE
jgi:hypothetical protein